MTNHTQKKTTIAPACIRALLLKQVTSNLDIIHYCNHFLNLELKRAISTVYRGTCPWCGEKEVFCCHQTAGTCYCESCKRMADFFEIVTTHWKLDIGFSIHLLTLELKKEAEAAQQESCETPGPGGGDL